MIVAIVHVAEEYFFGWIDFLNNNKDDLKIKIGEVKFSEFLFLNMIFIVMVVIAAILKNIVPVYALSIVLLVFVNTFVHVAPSIKLKRYMPGLFSALIGYLPLSIVTTIVMIREHNLSLINILTAFGLGTLIMLVPFIYQFIKARMINKA